MRLNALTAGLLAFWAVFAAPASAFTCARVVFSSSRRFARVLPLAVQALALALLAPEYRGEEFQQSEHVQKAEGAFLPGCSSPEPGRAARPHRWQPVEAVLGRCLFTLARLKSLLATTRATRLWRSIAAAEFAPN